MSTDPAEKALLGEMKLRELSRRARLMERVKGRKLSSWTDYFFLFFIAIFMFLAYLDRAHISQGDLRLFMVVMFLQVLHTTRQQKRLQAIAELLDWREKDDASSR